MFWKSCGEWLNWKRKERLGPGRAPYVSWERIRTCILCSLQCGDAEVVKKKWDNYHWCLGDTIKDGLDTNIAEVRSHCHNTEDNSRECKVKVANWQSVSYTNFSSHNRQVSNILLPVIKCTTLRASSLQFFKIFLHSACIIYDTHPAATYISVWIFH